MTMHLSVRPAPYTGESLASYAGRLAAANHISVTELMGAEVKPTWFRYGNIEVIEAVHALTGVPVEQLRSMAHPAVAGAAGSRKGFLGIRTRNPVICHHCHDEDGIRLLEWDHPLVTICFYCHGLLAPQGGGAEHVVPPHPLILDLTEVREIVLQRHEQGMRPAWKRVLLLAHMGRTIARHMTPQWPSPRIPVVRDAARRAAADLAEHPSCREVGTPPSIDLALVTIATCWDHTLDPAEAERFLRERIRAGHKNEATRLRRIERGRAHVAAWTRSLP